MAFIISPPLKWFLEIASRSDAVVLQHGGYDISIEKKKANSMPAPVPVFHERVPPIANIGTGIQLKPQVPAKFVFYT